MAAPWKVMCVCNHQRITAGKTLFLQMPKIYFRSYSSDLLVNHKVTIDPDIQQRLEAGEFQHRKHPGVCRTKTARLPKRLVKAVDLLMEKYPTANLDKQCQPFARYLQRRQLPPEKDFLTKKAMEVEEQYTKKEGLCLEELDSDDRILMENKIKSHVLKKLRSECYHWEAVKYDAYKSFMYLKGRMVQDYSVLYRIFSEIARRNPDFKPKTLFDFGSGVGSTVWCANTIWEQTLMEHYCVDPSADMNTLARLLLQDAEDEKDMCFDGVYFRQFFPPSHKNKYDLVVSAFTLMELPSKAERLKMILALWRKTEDFLVIVEAGSNSGFEIVAEARDTILKIPENQIDLKDADELGGHVFAPCPHDNACPRVERKDGTPCNFDVEYMPLHKSGQDNTKKLRSLFSYVVLRKGTRSESEVPWARIVREVSTPSKRAHCRTCGAGGQLEYSIITAKKHGRDLFWCARASRWGDLLPIRSVPEDDHTPEEHAPPPVAKESTADSGSSVSETCCQANPLPSAAS